MNTKQKNYYEITKIHDQDFINIEDIKQYLRLVSDDDDNLIKQFINSAIESCENYCGLNLFQREIKYFIHDFKGKDFTLVFCPIKTIISIKDHSDPERISRIDSYSVRGQESLISFDKKFYSTKLVIEYITGFDNQDLIPKSLVQGIIIHVAQMYDAGFYKAISEDLQKLYQPYKKVKI